MVILADIISFESSPIGDFHCAVEQLFHLARPKSHPKDPRELRKSHVRNAALRVSRHDLSSVDAEMAFYGEVKRLIQEPLPEEEESDDFPPLKAVETADVVDVNIEEGEADDFEKAHAELSEAAKAVEDAVSPLK